MIGEAAGARATEPTERASEDIGVQTGKAEDAKAVVHILQVGIVVESPGDDEVHEGAPLVAVDVAAAFFRREFEPQVVEVALAGDEGGFAALGAEHIDDPGFFQLGVALVLVVVGVEIAGHDDVGEGILAEDFIDPVAEVFGIRDPSGLAFGIAGAGFPVVGKNGERATIDVEACFEEVAGGRRVVGLYGENREAGENDIPHRARAASAVGISAFLRGDDDMVTLEAGFIAGFEQPGLGGDSGELGREAFFRENAGDGFIPGEFEPRRIVAHGCLGGLVDFDFIENDHIRAMWRIGFGENAGDVLEFGEEVLRGVFARDILAVIRDAIGVEEVFDIVGDNGKLAGAGEAGRQEKRQGEEIKNPGHDLHGVLEGHGAGDRGDPLAKRVGFEDLGMVSPSENPIFEIGGKADLEGQLGRAAGEGFDALGFMPDAFGGKASGEGIEADDHTRGLRRFKSREALRHHFGN